MTLAEEFRSRNFSEYIWLWGFRPLRSQHADQIAPTRYLWTMVSGVNSCKESGIWICCGRQCTLDSSNTHAQTRTERARAIIHIWTSREATSYLRSRRWPTFSNLGWVCYVYFFVSPLESLILSTSQFSSYSAPSACKPPLSLSHLPTNVLSLLWKYRASGLILIFVEIPLLLRICPTSPTFDNFIRRFTTNYMRAAIYGTMSLIQWLSIIADPTSLIAAAIVLLMAAVCYAIAGLKGQGFVGSKTLGGHGVAQMIV